MATGDTDEPGESGPGQGAAGGDGDGRYLGEMRRGGSIRTALIRGDTFGVKAVQYAEIDGLAIFEGDIVLGTVEEVERATEMLRAERGIGVASGVGISGAQFRWPNCRVPFTIDPALPNQARVTDAIAHWQARTNFRFVARTTQADYVTFRPGSGCSAAVGRRGGQQFVNLGPNCSLGNAIHEIGHVIGLWHEQSREDRDSFVRINWTKIQAGMEHNFNQHITDGDDIGPYDFGSIMHYPRDAFSVDGSDTITPIAAVPAGTVIGQRNALSAGDVAAANSLCTKPASDDATVTIKETAADTRKELVKDLLADTRKEQVLDTRKETVLDTRKEQVADTVKEGAFDPGGTTLAEGVSLPGQGGRLGGPVAGLPASGALPFVLATAQPPVGGGFGGQAMGGPGASADAAALQTGLLLDQQLQQLAQQLAALDAQRDLVQAQYDQSAALLAQLAAQGLDGGAG